MFEDLPLDRRLRLGLDSLGLSSPTAVQARAVPAALGGCDLQVNSPTGSGKTLAYLLPLAQRALAAGDGYPRGTLALVLVPTRDLARQVLKVCRGLLSKSPLQVHAITGGADFKYQRALLRKDPEILVATPGRLLEHCERRSADLGSLQTLVLDEADRMLDMGLRDAVLALADHCPRDRQTLLLSATLHQPGVAEIASRLLRTPQSIFIGAPGQTDSRVAHRVILADGREHKDQLLPALLRREDFRLALVFANRRSDVARIAALLRGCGLRCECLHGELTTEERARVLERYRDHRIDVLCASDVAARGMDVVDIDLVVNYDMPPAGKDYIHRTGRTGRAGHSGRAISLVGPADWDRMRAIEQHLNLQFEGDGLAGLKARFNGAKSRKPGARNGRNRRTDQRGSGDRARREPGPDRRRPAARKSTGNDGNAPLKKKPAH